MENIVDKVGLGVEHLVFLFPSIWLARDPKLFRNLIITYLSFLFHAITNKNITIVSVVEVWCIYVVEGEQNRHNKKLKLK